MNNLVQFRPRSPAIRKAGAAHTRALGAPMHRIPFCGEPMGATCDSSRGADYARRRAILWASWKAQKDHGLPDDLSGWQISAAMGEGLDSLYQVTLSPPPGPAWTALKVKVPAWQVAEGIILDNEPIEAIEPPCTETLTMALPAPSAALAALPTPAKARKAPTPRAKRWKPPKTIFIMTRRGVSPLLLPSALS